MKCFLAGLVAVFLCGGLIMAQCGPGGCGGGSCSGPYYRSTIYAPNYQWVSFPSDDSQVALFLDGIQAGGYSFKTGEYREYSHIRQEWGQRLASPPVIPPADLAAKYSERVSREKKKCECTGKENCTCPDGKCDCDNCKKDVGSPRIHVGDKVILVGAERVRAMEVLKLRDTFAECQWCDSNECHTAWYEIARLRRVSDYDNLPTGVVTEKVVPDKTCLNGKDVHASKAFEALVSDLPDDSGKCFITIIDADDTRRASERLFIDSLSQGKFQVQDINPTKPMESWMIDCGFKKPETNGVTVYAQAPNGKVIWRSDNFDQAKLTVALRKTDPNYNPLKDPDLNPHQAPVPQPPDKPQPEPKPDPPFGPLTKGALVVGGIVGACVLFSKKGSK
jgi:hypothetical protein